jgi:hypothetical protein
MASHAPPQKNPGGRPKNKVQPEDPAGAARLAAHETACLEAEDACTRKRKAWHSSGLMSDKRDFLAEELNCASMRRQWCLLHNDDGHALKYGEQIVRLSKAHMEAAESQAIDDAKRLADRQKKEHDVARAVGGKGRRS